MRGNRLYFVIILFFCASLFAQNKFEYDYSRFYNPQDESGYIELYYSFVKSALKSVTEGNQEVKQGVLSVKIVDLISNESIVNNSWQLDIGGDEVNDKLLVGVLDFPLEFSKYSIEITASDANNPEYLETSSFELDFPPFPEFGLMVSDIELATAIIPQAQNTNSIFYKNSVEVTPNPSLIYGDANPVIFFYSEIYGLSGNSGDSYLVEQKLFDSNDKVVFEKARNVTGGNTSIVDVGAIRVNEFTSGIYSLVISIKNKDNSVSAHSVKRVYIYNKKLIDASTDFAEETHSPLESELMMMSEDELNYMYETARYIAKEIEDDQWNKLTSLDSKRSFLAEFWRKRDTNVNSPVNEYKQDYYERVRYANKTFGNMSRREGWKTDRGRVFITYGKPGEIERFQNEYYSDPYEIWHYYDLEGGVIFLFADEEGLNIYRLVHSTKKGELYNYSNYLKYVQ